MVLGALVDAGVDGSRLEQALSGLGISGYRLSFNKETRGALSGTRACVEVEETDKDRRLPEIVDIIRDSSLDEEVKNGAVSVFERLADAEAAVHGTSADDVYFHEVGALDAIVDIVGAVVGLKLLGAERLFSSSLVLGTGTVKCRHGVLPIPAPAVVRLVKGFEVRLTSVEGELTTPTGAAIITTLAEPPGAVPSFVVESVGYGFGSRKGAANDPPNALRLVKGRTCVEKGLEEVVLLETNLDDVTGEVAGYLIEQCLERGALDAFVVPVQMKKSRPGILFSALCRLDLTDALVNLLHMESRTLGVRIQRVSRSILPREVVTVDTSLGPVRVKKAGLPGQQVFCSPEYEDAARIAREKGMPLWVVMETIRAEI